MKRVFALLLIILTLIASSPAAQNPYEQPGPTLAKVARGHRLDNMPQWRVDFIKGLEAMETAGGDSEFICEHPECACHIITHRLVCFGYIVFDCHRHIFVPCKHIEIIN